ncbi:MULTISPECIES: RNA polymerase sigma factor sigma-70 region 4 domain-containing protein [Actinomycetaceae]|uniref:sigma-70 region 4 domain-containing protein n=1 Tax=Actinomycetaceae TaxID=2049 RepID=UPI00131EF10E|nr:MULTISPECIES: sigma-70 region 4 domain-containing protein [Actinomycetaceae]MDY5585075.1 hypothetical protein [Arcanobacterium sp.]
MALTEHQKQVATRIREQGGTPKQIAELLLVSLQDVKNFLARAKITTKAVSNDDDLWCAWCGEALETSKFNSRKRFCNDAHRLKWWAVNRHHITPRTRQPQRCLNCGTVFVAWSSAARKYCDHGCYIQHRYGTKGGKP